MDNKKFEEINDNDEFVLTPWGCMMGVLSDYGIDASRLTPVMGAHLVDDFLAAMARNGYLKKAEEDE